MKRTIATALVLALGCVALFGPALRDCDAQLKPAPIEVAVKAQTTSGYKADTWKLATLKVGDVVYGGVPGQTEFYTTKQTVDASDRNAVTLFKSLQVKPHPVFGYRTKVQEYCVKQEISVPYGKALANPNLGPGGGEQYFIANFKDVLTPGKILELKK